MMTNDRIYIIDDNESRRKTLHTIFDFIGYPTEALPFVTLEKESNLNPSIILLGACASLEQTTKQLAFLTKLFPQVPGT
jgi:sigma-54 dependent transcriptional regulator, flagellar regulatory protein